MPRPTASGQAERPSSEGGGPRGGPLRPLSPCLSSAFACSIEHVDNFTVVLSHRMQGMAKLHDELLVLNQVCQMAKNGWHIRRGRLAASHPLLHPVLAIRRSYPR